MVTILEQGEMGRLQATFFNAPVSSHGSKWDDLWKDSYTPWDRGGPSLALLDTITSKTDLFPPPPPPNAKRHTALVPGCGRGHDVILLSELGYDVVGLDYSAAAVREAAILEKEVRNDGKGKEAYQSLEGKGGDKGSITWVEGDFFHNAWLRTVGKTQFDVIFDYTVNSHTILMITHI
jgi:SAM-dependent methyltransferase